MNLERVEKIAKAVLYEGYMLYPYRPTATKNAQRFNFGVAYPRAYSEAQSGADSWFLRTETALEGGAETQIEIVVRFLHLRSRVVGRFETPLEKFDPTVPPDFRIVDRLTLGGKVYRPWEDAVEREVRLPVWPLGELTGAPREHRFSFPANRETVGLADPEGRIAGVLVNTQESVRGRVAVSARAADEACHTLAVEVQNGASFSGEGDSRQEALKRSLVSTHTILGVRRGRFVSLLDPPERLRMVVQTCRNVGTWPVMVGEPGETDCMLSSPITLYDYPQIAPETNWDLFDGTEIDELLSLRILTLTDEEKREMRDSDERARRILDQVEEMDTDQLMKLHGTLRQLRPVGEDGP